MHKIKDREISGGEKKVTQGVYLISPTTSPPALSPHLGCSLPGQQLGAIVHLLFTEKE
jgi:hypothetical protein